MDYTTFTIKIQGLLWRRLTNSGILDIMPVAKIILSITAGLLIASGGYASYVYWQQTNATIASLTSERDRYANNLATTSQKLFEAESSIASLERDVVYLNEELAVEFDRNAEFAKQIQQLSGTVNDLSKLAKTDRELLQKYSRVFFLSENYIPARLTQIRDEYVLEGRKDQYFHTDAIRWLERMIRDAARDGITLRVLSAYRSFDEQHELKGQFTRQYGTGANTFSADQGYSEHQLGTAVDIVDPDTNGTFQSFAETDTYAWLLDNAHRYGFILSYPEGNQFYIFEPWHWRFVGRELATDLYDEGAFFYDWDQRRIDEYLLSLFD